MLRYLVLSWEQHEPGGGMNDFVSDHATLEDAIAAAVAEVERIAEATRACAEVYDTHLRSEVWSKTLTKNGKVT